MERLLTLHTVTGKDQPPTEPGEDLSCCAEGGLVGSSGHAIAGPSWAVEDDCCDFGDNTFQACAGESAASRPCDGSCGNGPKDREQKPQDPG